MVTATGDSTSSVEDLVIGTKVRLVPEGVSRPAFGFRFATKLPNASNESGLGLDTTDFYASLIVGKTVQSVRLVSNVGLGILGDPTRGDRQNDVLTYGVSFARAVTQAAEVVGEVNGRVNMRDTGVPPGTESRSAVRFGARYTIGGWRADAALMFGVTSSDPVDWHDCRIHVRLQRLSGSLMRGLPVCKANAYGNDFLLVPRQDVRTATTHLARHMCDRHTGIGADGLILYELRERGATMELLNADGSPSELSGNGLRCLAALVARDQNLQPSETVTVDTGAGVKTLELLERDRGTFTFRAALGQPTDVREVKIPVLGEDVTASVMNMGNPQCVVLGPLPDRERFMRLGPALSTHPMFPAGTNVEFAHVEAPDRVQILIWERGVGPTTSSGTGSSASAVAAAAHGGAGRTLDVVAPGGTQRVEWHEAGVYLTGWAVIVLDGEWWGAGKNACAARREGRPCLKNGSPVRNRGRVMPVGRP